MDYIFDNFLNFYSLTSPAVLDLTCVNDSYIFKREAKEFTPWALKMYDSSSKFPSAVLSGNLQDLGNYDECISARSKNFVGKYCLLEAAVSDTSQERVISHFLENRKAIIWAQCIPSSCSKEDLLAHLNYVNNNYSYFKSVDVKHCYSINEGLSIDILSLTVLFCLILWILVVSLATLIESKYLETFLKKYVSGLYSYLSHKKYEKTIAAFSLSKNWASLSHLSSGDSMLSCINGIRFLSMLSIIMLHQMVRELATPYINQDEVNSAFTGSVLSMALANSSIAVDTFFLLSGTLVSYNFMSERQKRRKFSVISFYIHRYFRLTPIYFVVLCIAATLWTYIGKGPLWNLKTEPFIKNCHQNWIYNVLYVNNYIKSKPNESCLPHTWYLSADMQLYCVSSFLLFCLYKKPICGKLLITCLSVGSIYINYYLTVQSRYPWTYSLQISLEQGRNYFSEVYVKAHTRAVPYLIGLLFGDILYNCRHHKVSIKKTYFWMYCAMSFVCSMIIIFSLYFYYHYEYDATVAGLYAAFHHPLWALCSAWLIFICASNTEGVISTILSCPILQFLGKLTYCVYLIHYLVIIHELAVTRTTSYFSLYNMFWKLCKNIAITIVLSIIATLFFEMPAVQLSKMFIQKKVD